MTAVLGEILRELTFGAVQNRCGFWIHLFLTPGVGQPWVPTSRAGAMADQLTGEAHACQSLPGGEQGQWADRGGNSPGEARTRRLGICGDGS